MGLPGLIPGGTVIWDDPSNYSNDVLADIGHSLSTSGSTGAFARSPGSTPKYAINQGQRDAEYRETMARLFIQMSGQERDQFVQSVPAETRPLAKLLCGVGQGASGGTGFIDFLLTQVSEPFQEKFQVVETLSDNFVVYMFGQAAPQFQYSGVLLNSYQDDQRVWMMRMYRDILRGTQLARRRKLVRLRYDSVIVSGILVAHQQALDGTQENSAQFSFTMIPMQYTIFTPAYGNPTQLKTPFIPSGKYALNSTALPDLKQQRAVAPPRAPVPAARMATDKEPDLLKESPLSTDETPQGQLPKRVALPQSIAPPAPGVYKGKFPSK